MKLLFFVLSLLICLSSLVPARRPFPPKALDECIKLMKFEKGGKEECILFMRLMQATCVYDRPNNDYTLLRDVFSLQKLGDTDLKVEYESICEYVHTMTKKDKDNNQWAALGFKKFVELVAEYENDRKLMTELFQLLILRFDEAWLQQKLGITREVVTTIRNNIRPLNSEQEIQDDVNKIIKHLEAFKYNYAGENKADLLQAEEFIIDHMSETTLQALLKCLQQILEDKKHQQNETFYRQLAQAFDQTRTIKEEDRSVVAKAAKKMKMTGIGLDRKLIHLLHKFLKSNSPVSLHEDNRKVLLLDVEASLQRTNSPQQFEMLQRHRKELINLLGDALSLPGSESRKDNSGLLAEVRKALTADPSDEAKDKKLLATIQSIMKKLPESPNLTIDSFKQYKKNMRGKGDAKALNFLLIVLISSENDIKNNFLLRSKSKIRMPSGSEYYFYEQEDGAMRAFMKQSPNTNIVLPFKELTSQFKDSSEQSKENITRGLSTRLSDLWPKQARVDEFGAEGNHGRRSKRTAKGRSKNNTSL